MNRPKRLRTILHDDQPILQSELDLLHTPALQRLYELHQLGLADRIYIDASHSRLHHVIGVLTHVDKLVAAIIRNLRRNPGQQLRAGSSAKLADDVDGRRGIIRLIGLLHDLTHAPYGHTVEDEINLIKSKHDEPSRQADAFYRLLCQYVGWLGRDADVPTHHGNSAVPGGFDNPTPPAGLTRFLDDPQLNPPSDWESVADFAASLLRRFEADNEPVFWRLSARQIPNLLEEMHVAMTALLHLELLHKDFRDDDQDEALKKYRKYLPEKDGYPFQWVIEKTLQKLGRPLSEDLRFQPRRDAYMIDLVGNTVCADLLDYAKRDAHFANLKLDYDADRIAENFTLVDWNATAYAGDEGRDRRPLRTDDPFGDSCLRTAIALFSHKLRADTLGELMNLLNVRFYLYERVVFHPTKCAADAMLV